MPLTVPEVKAAARLKSSTKLADPGGLYLLVDPNGMCWWRRKFRFGGVERSLALGAFPAITLKKARDGRNAAAYFGEPASVVQKISRTSAPRRPSGEPFRHRRRREGRQR
jgi:hypothetical protein